MDIINAIPMALEEYKRKRDFKKTPEPEGTIAPKRTDTTVLVCSEFGYGKRSDVTDYRLTRRGGKGVITMKATDKTGKLLAIKEL